MTLNEIGDFEAKYNLALLAGPDLVVIEEARHIRGDFLSQIKKRWRRITAGMAKKRRQRLRACVKRFEGEYRAEAWVATCGSHCTDAEQFILTLPVPRVPKVQRSPANKKAPAVPSRKQIIKCFEETYGLPALVSPSGSILQCSYGQRCRFDVLRDLAPEQLLEQKQALTLLTHPGVWIGATKSKWTLYEVVRRYAPQADDALQAGK
jgi:hypothetical protein